MRLTKQQKEALENHSFLIFGNVSFYLSIDGYYSVMIDSRIIYQNADYARARAVLSFHVDKK